MASLNLEIQPEALFREKMVRRFTFYEFQTFLNYYLLLYFAHPATKLVVSAVTLQVWDAPLDLGKIHPTFNPFGVDKMNTKTSLELNIGGSVSD